MYASPVVVTISEAKVNWVALSTELTRANSGPAGVTTLTLSFTATAGAVVNAPLESINLSVVKVVVVPSLISPPPATNVGVFVSAFQAPLYISPAGSSAIKFLTKAVVAKVLSSVAFAGVGAVTSPEKAEGWKKDIKFAVSSVKRINSAPPVKNLNLSAMSWDI